MASFARGITFATNGTVTAENLHNLIDQTTPRAGIITDRSVLTTMSTGDKVLIADTDDATNAYFITSGSLVGQALSGATYAGASLTAGTIATFNSTTGTVTNLTSSTATISTLSGNTTGGTYSGNIVATAGTVTTLTASTASVTNLPGAVSGGTYSGNVIATAGTVTTLTASTGTITNLSTTTGTITNLTTTLAGDFTISAGTGTLGTTGVTAGTYGTSTAAVTLTLDAKGRVTTVSTSAISSTPADGSITPAKLSQPLTLGTAVTSTSGTAVDFTGIPSWVRRITVIIYRVSTTGGSLPTLRLGTSGGIVSSGYECNGGYQGAAGTNATSTDGFVLNNTANFGAASSLSGLVILSNVTGNNWSCAFSFGLPFHHSGGGSVSLSGALDRLRLTTEGGTETFDAGSVNIMYEG